MPCCPKFRHISSQGAYGAPPAPLPKPLPGYQKRERKPKVYSGYAVSSDCCMHADKLIQNEQSRGQTVRRRSAPVPARRASTLPRSQGARGPSPAPSRNVRGPSPAPSVDSYGARPTDWKNSLRGTSASREDPPRVRRKPSVRRESLPKQPSVERSPTPRSPTPERRPSPQRRSLSSDGQSHRSSTGSTDWGYTSYSSFLSGAKTSTASLQSSRRCQNLSAPNCICQVVFKQQDLQQQHQEIFDQQNLRGKRRTIRDWQHVLGRPQVC